MAARATLSHDDYTVGWICALPLEMAAAKLMLDAIHPSLPRPPTDQNTYILGNIGDHNIVIACLPSGAYGIVSATTVAMQLLSSFHSIRFGLMVGIGGGVPNGNADVRLGDIVVSQPTDTSGGVIQYDLGKVLSGGQFQRTGMLNRPPKVLLTALATLQAHYFTEESRILEFISELQSDPGRQYQQGNMLQTWMILYLEIQKRDPNSADLLLLLAHFDNRDIWYELVKSGRHSSNVPDWLKKAISSGLEFKIGMKSLIGFSLLESKQQEGSYAMHPVVQDWCLHIANTNKNGKLKEAEEMYQRALAGYEKALGPNHTSTLVTVNNLGNLFSDQGKLKEAEEMYQRALVGQEEALGPNHTSTLDTVNNLGVLYKYPRANAQFRLALIFASASMAGAFSGLLAFAISKMDGVGGLEGWRWIFILEGLLTVVCAVLAFFVIWDEPSTATFLSDREKAIIIDLLADSRASSSEGQLEEKSAFDWKQFLAAVLDWQTWMHAISYWGAAVAVYALSLFLPTIIKGLGYSSAIAQLLTIPVYAAASIACIAVGYFSDRMGQRSLFTLVCYGAVFVGFLIAVAPSRFIPGLTYAGCFIAASGSYPAIPGLLALSSNNYAPATKRAVGMAIQIGLGSLGGAAASNFYKKTDAPRYRLGHSLVLAFVALGFLTVVLYYFLCRRINAKRDRGEATASQNPDGIFEMGDKAPTFRYNL
ncbi:hypothetical protein PENNAL_c0129G06796 [Penicillium nalgiovense]|uniref:Major facilitator superfamily (MFS) profile domain-containing protein n=1 Tax=Penicillium nalgiovense TaxID=60175 RepID=A0A1V6X3N3_PENNA|nr:hypothetical protein PENNAL_c0129G06796 [Penicillium nalgiovense]